MKSLAKLLVVGLMVASVNCGKKSTEAETPAASGGGGGGGATCTGKVMYVTSVTDGSFGGAAGADVICNANKPSGLGSSTFKAYLSDIGSRAACYISGNDDCTASTVGRVDWPLAPSTTYCSLTDETIGTTSADALMAAIGYVDSANAYKYFTGFNSHIGISNSNNCSDYTVASVATSNAGRTNSGFGGGQSLACNSAGYILCVEQ